MTSTASTACAAPKADFFTENTSIVSKIFQYLGVRSLITFSACRKNYHELLLLPEVARRKTLFAEHEENCNLLLQLPNRGNVLKAQSLLKKARDLVDGELGWCDSAVWVEDDEEQKEASLGIMRHSPFFEQIQRLSDPPSRPPFSMLPLCFYIPPNGEPHRPSPGGKLEALGQHYATWIWGAEDHMGSFYEMVGLWDPYYQDLKFPFRKIFFMRRYKFQVSFCESCLVNSHIVS